MTVILFVQIICVIIQTHMRIVKNALAVSFLIVQKERKWLKNSQGGQEMTVMERLANSVVVPVVVLDKAEDAVPTARAMAATSARVIMLFCCCVRAKIMD